MLNGAFNDSDVANALEQGLVFSVDDPTTGYRLYSYSKSAPYTPGAWDNPFVRIARGLIVDMNGGLVARPWPKFFNYGQEGVDLIDPDQPVEVTDKLDGSLGIAFLEQDGTPRIATRGSFISHQAIKASKWLQEMSSELYLSAMYHFTFLFEIVYPDNRIVVDYGGFEGLILLGAVHMRTGDHLGPEDAKGLLGWTERVAETFPYRTLKEALEAPPRDNAEGLVIRQGNKMLKIKQEDYIRLHRIVTGLNRKTIWEAMMNNTFEELLGDLPDEFQMWALEQKLGFELDVEWLMEGAEYAYDQVMGELGPDSTKKQFAELAKERGKLAPYLFAMYDGKDVEKMYLKALKPKLGVTDD